MEYVHILTLLVACYLLRSCFALVATKGDTWSLAPSVPANLAIFGAYKLLAGLNIVTQDVDRWAVVLLVFVLYAVITSHNFQRNKGNPSKDFSYQFEMAINRAANKKASQLLIKSLKEGGGYSAEALNLLNEHAGSLLEKVFVGIHPEKLDPELVQKLTAEKQKALNARVATELEKMVKNEVVNKINEMARQNFGTEAYLRVPTLNKHFGTEEELYIRLTTWAFEGHLRVGHYSNQDAVPESKLPVNHAILGYAEWQKIDGRHDHVLIRGTKAFVYKP